MALDSIYTSSSVSFLRSRLARRCTCSLTQLSHKLMMLF